MNLNESHYSKIQRIDIRFRNTIYEIAIIGEYYRASGSMEKLINFSVD